MPRNSLSTYQVQALLSQFRYAYRDRLVRMFSPFIDSLVESAMNVLRETLLGYVTREAAGSLRPAPPVSLPQPSAGLAPSIDPGISRPPPSVSAFPVVQSSAPEDPLPRTVLRRREGEWRRDVVEAVPSISVTAPSVPPLPVYLSSSVTMSSVRSVPTQQTEVHSPSLLFVPTGVVRPNQTSILRQRLTNSPVSFDSDEEVVGRRLQSQEQEVQVGVDTGSIRKRRYHDDDALAHDKRFRHDEGW